MVTRCSGYPDQSWKPTMGRSWILSFCYQTLSSGTSSWLSAGVKGNVWGEYVGALGQWEACSGGCTCTCLGTNTADGFWESQDCPPCSKIAHVNRWPYTASILCDGDVQPWNVICYAIYQNSHPPGALGPYWEGTRKNERQACFIEINSCCCFLMPWSEFIGSLVWRQNTAVHL